MKQYFALQYWKGQRLLLLAFLLLHVVVATIHISQQDVITDEPGYYTYAARWLHGDVERTDKMFDSKTPVVAIALIPRIIKQLMHPGFNAMDAGRADILSGRYLMVFFTIVISVYLFSWSRILFGCSSWLLPVLFFLFDPMVISYSMIITSDMASGACLLATLYHLHQFFLKRKWKDFICFATWVGMGFVCKASLLFLVPCFVVLYLFLLTGGAVRFNLRKLFIYGLILTAISIVVINVAYFGKESFHSLNNTPLFSTSFKKLAATPVLNRIPIPVPKNYVVALDLLQYHQEIGAGKAESSYPGAFLNGELRRHSGFWYYYFYVGFYKIPVSILALLLCGVFTFIISFRRKVFVQTHLWYALPATFFFVVLSCFNPFQIGLRHILLIYPLLFIGVAALIAYWKRRSRFTITVAAILFTLMVLSEAMCFPDLIPYTNEFLTDKKNVFRKIKDASIDYGQNLKLRDEYILRHPGTRLPSLTPQPGRYIATMADLIDETPESGMIKYTWLLHFEPVDHYRYSMFIFNISEDDIRLMQQKSRR
jgi:hypothetical protein